MMTFGGPTSPWAAAREDVCPPPKNNLAGSATPLYKFPYET